MKVDNGLRRLGGRRLPAGVLDVDLPALALAVTCVVRGQAAAQVFRSGDVGFVRIAGRGFDVSMRASDWEKVLVQVKDEAFTTAVVPVETGLRPLDTPVRLSASTVEMRDPLYQRVRWLLGQLFTERVPT